MKRAADDRGMQVFLGVDTHSEAHVGVALDQAGRRLGTLEIPNERAGYARLLEWVLGFGVLVAAGVEGAASCGAGPPLSHRAKGGRMLEVSRANRHPGRRYGKHDAGDAE